MTYTVTLSTAPTVDETFTFDVDGVERTITVLAGQTTGTTTVAYDDADVFIDAETVGIASNFAASAANGASNYESLTLTNNASGETLEDTIDASTATLSSAIVGDEDAATVTYTVTLSTAPTVDETFTFDVDGVERTITVAATGTTTVRRRMSLSTRSASRRTAYDDADVFIDDRCEQRCLRLLAIASYTVTLSTAWTAMRTITVLARRTTTMRMSLSTLTNNADGENYESLTLTNNASGDRGDRCEHGDAELCDCWR